MWYRHFNKDSWQMRLWRNKNLTFKYNELGFMADLYTNRLKTLALRVFGHEGSLRMFNLMFFLFVASTYSYFDNKRNGEKKRQLAEKAE